MFSSAGNPYHPKSSIPRMISTQPKASWYCFSYYGTESWCWRVAASLSPSSCSGRIWHFLLGGEERTLSPPVSLGKYHNFVNLLSPMSSPIANLSPPMNPGWCFSMRGTPPKDEEIISISLSVTTSEISFIQGFHHILQELLVVLVVASSAISWYRSNTQQYRSYRQYCLSCILSGFRFSLTLLVPDQYDNFRFARLLLGYY